MLTRVRFSFAILLAVLPACELYFGDDREPLGPDAALPACHTLSCPDTAPCADGVCDCAGVLCAQTAAPPSEPPPSECLGFDCPDAGADTDAFEATHPPFPTPSPCDLCVGFACEAACADAGVDAP